MRKETIMRIDTDADVDSRKISFEIVAPEPEAVKLIMEWRNDPHTLKQSFHGELKSWPDFFSEYQNDYCADQTLPSLFALLEGKRIGFLRFRRIVDPIAGPLRRSLKTCDISINVAPEHRGHGLGRLILKSVLPVVRSWGVDSVLAEVKIDNTTSVSMFEAAGFRICDEIDHLVTDLGIKFPVKRMIYDLIETVPVPGDKHIIGAGQPCFIIAEAGSNWRMGTAARDLKMAKALIDVAAEAGADAVKFQTYRPETTYVRNAGESDYLSNSGIKESIIHIFADLSMPYDMIPGLAEYCKSRNILFMSSPFSITDLERVDAFVDIHKIASYEISHLRLIEAAARTGKPLVLSTGGSYLSDIHWAVNLFRSLSQAPLCLMQCTAQYPAALSALNLSTIPVMKATFGLPVGFSDHSRHPFAGPVAAVALGANLIEKHFTLDNRLPGPDHAFALEPDELKQMVEAIRAAEQVSGSGAKEVLKEEEELYWYARRGLQATRVIDTGEPLVEGKNFDILRPGKQQRGLHPMHLEHVSNSRAARRIEIGEGILHDNLANY